MKPLILFDFNNAADMTGWESVDDVVMGGISSSRILWLEDNYLSFMGEVSLENNGGFASIRSPGKDYQLEGTKGIGIRILGDGKKYKLTIRTDSSFDGVSYQVIFPTSQGVWQELTFLYDKFVPTYHGQLMSTEPSLDPVLIKRFGFIISEKQEGAFQLNIASIWGIF